MNNFAVSLVPIRQFKSLTGRMLYFILVSVAESVRTRVNEI